MGPAHQLVYVRLMVAALRLPVVGLKAGLISTVTWHSGTVPAEVMTA